MDRYGPRSGEERRWRWRRRSREKVEEVRSVREKREGEKSKVVATKLLLLW